MTLRERPKINTVTISMQNMNNVESGRRRRVGSFGNWTFPYVRPTLRTDDYIPAHVIKADKQNALASYPTLEPLLEPLLTLRLSSCMQVSLPLILNCTPCLKYANFTELPRGWPQKKLEKFFLKYANFTQNLRNIRKLTQKNFAFVHQNVGGGVVVNLSVLIWKITK